MTLCFAGAIPTILMQFFFGLPFTLDRSASHFFSVASCNPFLIVLIHIILYSDFIWLMRARVRAYFRRWNFQFFSLFLDLIQCVQFDTMLLLEQNTLQHLFGFYLCFGKTIARKKCIEEAEMDAQFGMPWWMLGSLCSRARMQIIAVSFLALRVTVK